MSAPALIASAFVACVSSGSGSAAADAAEGAGEIEGDAFADRELRLSLGTGLTLGLSEVQERSSDVVGITQAAYRWNASVSGGYRIARSWELGVRGSWGSDAGARATGGSEGAGMPVTRSLWQLGAEARHQPWGPLRVYFAATAGAAAAVDSIGEESATQWAPALGGALGCDFAIAEPFALGLELRGGAAWFGDEGAVVNGPIESERVIYGPSAWIGLNLAALLWF